LPACLRCNNDLSSREERLRNALVRMFSHDPAVHADVFQRAARSRQPLPQELKAGYSDTPAGLFAPATVIELPGDEDVEPVFRGITRGLFFKLLGRLMPQGVAVRSVLLQANDADRLTARISKNSRVITFDNQFSFMPVIHGDNMNNSVWLYLLFNAGVVGSFTGEAAQLQFRPARLAVAHPRR
jgi:hypothetical protein